MGEVNGKIRISNDAIAGIAAVAAGEVEGVAVISRTFRKKIKVIVEGGEVYLDIPIKVDNDVEVPGICEAVQERVKNAIESSTGLIVCEVKILISEVNTK